MRPLVTHDLPDVFEIERECYAPALRESEAAVLAKMALFRAGALGCFRDTELCGYAFALPWRAGAIIAVAEVIDALPARPDTMYIHDMVVAPAHRRTGVASALFAEIARSARALGLGRMALVAVQGSEPFWEKLGFRAVERFQYLPGVPATRMETEPPA